MFTQRRLEPDGSKEVISMKSVFIKAWKLPQLILALAGLSLLLASCAGTGQKTTSLDSAFPFSYSAGARGFESHWPYGPAGYH